MRFCWSIFLLNIDMLFFSPEFVLSHPWHHTFPRSMSNPSDITLASRLPHHPASIHNTWFDDVVIDMGSDSELGSGIGLAEKYAPIYGTRYSPRLPRWSLGPLPYDARTKQDVSDRYSDVTWASWRLKSSVTRLTVPQLDLSGTENAKGPHQSSVDSPHKGLVMRKAFPCHVIFMFRTNLGVLGRRLFSNGDI